MLLGARTVFLAGHAKLPQGSAAQSVYENLCITVEVDPKYHVVIRASCNLVTELGRDYVERLLVGFSLRDGLGPIMTEVRTLYQGAAQNAIIAALRDLQKCYERWIGIQT